MTWLVVVRLAAIVIVVWAVVLQVTAGVFIPPVLVVGIAFAALLAFLRSGWRWAGMAAAVLGLVSVTGNIPSLVDELSHPSSAVAFTLTLVAAMAAVVLVVAGLAVFFGWSAKPTALLWGGPPPSLLRGRSSRYRRPKVTSWWSPGRTCSHRIDSPPRRAGSRSG